MANSLCISKHDPSFGDFSCYTFCNLGLLFFLLWIRGFANCCPLFHYWYLLFKHCERLNVFDCYSIIFFQYLNNFVILPSFDMPTCSIFNALESVVRWIPISGYGGKFLSMLSKSFLRRWVCGWRMNENGGVRNLFLYLMKMRCDVESTFLYDMVL